MPRILQSGEDAVGKPIPEKNKWFIAVLATAIAAFFYHKGDKVTGLIGGLTASLGAFTVNEWGVIIGIVLGIASFVLTWVYKQKYLEAIRQSSTDRMMEDEP